MTPPRVPIPPRPQSSSSRSSRSGARIFTASVGPRAWPGQPLEQSTPIASRFDYPPIGRQILGAIGALGLGLALWPLGHLTRWQWVADRQQRNLFAFEYATAQLKDWADRQKARRP